MSLVAGIQSAIFYYLSCGPWHGYSYNRKRRRQAKSSKKEKRALAMEQPDLHINPAPFEMNPGWAEEVRAGPGPPPRRAKKKPKCDSASTRHLNSAGTQSTSRTLGSNIELDSLNGVDRVDSWGNSRFAQRADEEPWTSTSTIAVPPTAHSMRRGSSIGLSGWTSTPPQETHYTSSKPIPKACIDTLPPFISTPTGNMSWMKEPPPSAGFMSGKETDSTRSRAESRASTRLGMRTPVPQHRAQERIQELRAERIDSAHDPDGQPHDRNMRGRRSPLPKASEYSLGTESSTSDILPPLGLVKVPKPTYDAALGIPSAKTRTVSPILEEKSNSTRKSPTSKRNDQSPIVIRDSSLHTLQELVSPNALLNSRFIRAPAVEARFPLPPSDSAESLQLKMPTIVDGWFAREELNGVIPEPKHRSMRWSMDI